MRGHRIAALLAALALIATAAATGVSAQTTTATESVTGAFVYEGEQLTIEAAPSQQLRGETSLPAGSRVTVRIQSSDASSPFIQRVETTVGEDGSFTATGDFSPVDPDTTFEATLRYNGTTIAETTGRVVGCADDCTQTPSETDRSTTLPTDEPGFANTIIQVQQGRTVEIPVAVGERGRVALTIGDDDANYWLNATLTDGDDDSRVIVVFDTAAAGTDRASLSPADDADRVEIDGETTLSDPLDPSEYSLTLYRSGNHEAEFDIGTVVVVEAGTATPASRSATPTAPLDDTTPSRDRSVDLGGLGALSVGLLLGVVGIVLLLGLVRH